MYLMPPMMEDFEDLILASTIDARVSAKETVPEPAVPKEKEIPKNGKILQRSDCDEVTIQIGQHKHKVLLQRKNPKRKVEAAKNNVASTTFDFESFVGRICNTLDQDQRVKESFKQEQLENKKKNKKGKRRVQNLEVLREEVLCWNGCSYETPEEIIATIPQIEQDYDQPEYVMIGDNMARNYSQIVSKLFGEIEKLGGTEEPGVIDESGKYICDHDYLETDRYLNKESNLDVNKIDQNGRYLEDHDYLVRTQPISDVNKEFDYFCNICSKMYSDVFSLSKHLHTHRKNNRRSCPVCKETFLSTECLNGHLTEHRVECDRCGSLVPISQMKMHRMECTGDNRKCDNNKLVVLQQQQTADHGRDSWTVAGVLTPVSLVPVEPDSGTASILRTFLLRQMSSERTCVGTSQSRETLKNETARSLHTCSMIPDRGTFSTQKFDGS